MKNLFENLKIKNNNNDKNENVPEKFLVGKSWHKLHDMLRIYLIKMVFPHIFASIFLPDEMQLGTSQ